MNGDSRKPDPHKVRALLDRALHANLILQWDEYEDSTWPGGVFWKVSIKRGDVWKMTPNMVAAFDKGLRTAGAYLTTEKEN